MSSLLTRNKDIDTKIIMSLDEKDLENLALLDNFAKKLLEDDNFWKMKFSDKYKISNLKNELYLFENYTWRDFLTKNLKKIFSNAVKFEKTKLIQVFLLDEKISEKHILIEVQKACEKGYIDYIELILSNKKLSNYFNEFFFNVNFMKIDDNNLVKITDLLIKNEKHICAEDLRLLIESGKKKTIRFILKNHKFKDELIPRSKMLFQESCYYYEETGDYEMIRILISSYLNNPWGFK